MATEKKLNILKIYKWGMLVYIWLCKIGKLKLKVEEGKFIGVDKDKDAALSLDSVQIEGEWDILVNLDSLQASTPSNSPKIATQSTSSTPPNIVKLEFTINNPPPLKNV
ncbi:hypothetical protein C0995_004776 [Termitomyces sp. Mi166|nr:hypothetical protein C0995_004776 [Termitomyces sp. Mi166\